jgi:2-haloacid dehalogenase/putative hydrolase of the HAD superfamily
MPKAVLWDVGNVIVRWNPRTLYEKFFEEPAECDRFLSHVCTMEWHVRHDLGVTFAENRVELLARFPEYSEAIHAWESRWWEMFSGTIAETEAAIEALHERGAPQFVLSNMSHEVFDGITAMSPAFKRIEGFVISAHEKLMKPQAEIYRRACERFGYAPQDLFFVDDSAWNIAGAAELGFDTLHFTDPADLWPALEARGLL